MKTSKLYKGIISSDKFIHSHINEILNYFNGCIVKVMSNAKVTKYLYKDGVKTDVIQGYDDTELNRNANGCANILVKRNNGQYWDNTYFYVSASVFYEEGSSKAYFNIPIDLIDVAGKFSNNRFLVYSKLDEKWFNFSYKDVVDDYIAKRAAGAKEMFFNYKGYQYFKYELDMSTGLKLNSAEHQNAQYFKNVHIGVTRYSKSIAGTHCFVRVFSKATGRPTTKQATEFRSFAQAFKKLNEWKVLPKMSLKTFVRAIYKNQLFETEQFIFQVSTEKESLLKEIAVVKTTEDKYLGVVEVFKSLGEIIEENDIKMAAEKNMTVEEFNVYCLEKYNSHFDDGNVALTEAVSPEDIEAVNLDAQELPESFYRNLNQEEFDDNELPY